MCVVVDVGFFFFFLSKTDKGSHVVGDIAASAVLLHRSFRVKRGKKRYSSHRCCFLSKSEIQPKAGVGSVNSEHLERTCSIVAETFRDIHTVCATCMELFVKADLLLYKCTVAAVVHSSPPLHASTCLCSV